MPLVSRGNAFGVAVRSHLLSSLSPCYSVIAVQIFACSRYKMADQKPVYVEHMPGKLRPIPKCVGGYLQLAEHMGRVGPSSTVSEIEMLSIRCTCKLS